MALRLFDSFGSGSFGFSHLGSGRERTPGTGAYPPFNLYGTEEKLVLTSEVPGMSITDFDLSVKGNLLTLKGKRELSNLGDSGHSSHRERYSGAFERTLSLPFNIDSKKVEASYETGVLRVDLPKAETEKPRKIKIKAA
jgi:HSP20 family protein